MNTGESRLKRKFLSKSIIFFLINFSIIVNINTNASSESGAEIVNIKELLYLYCFDSSSVLTKTNKIINTKDSDENGIKLFQENQISIKAYIRSKRASFISELGINKQSKVPLLNEYIGKSIDYIKSKLGKPEQISDKEIMYAIPDTEEIAFRLINGKVRDIKITCGASAD